MSKSETKDVSFVHNEVVVPGYLRASRLIAYVLYAWTTIGVVLLGLRVFLLAFSANTATPFVEFVYRTSADYLVPFRGIFPPKSFGETGYFDVAALFAIVIYLLVSWVIGELVRYIQYKIDTTTAEQKEELRVARQKTPQSRKA